MWLRRVALEPPPAFVTRTKTCANLREETAARGLRIGVGDPHRGPCRIKVRIAIDGSRRDGIKRLAAKQFPPPLGNLKALNVSLLLAPLSSDICSGSGVREVTAGDFGDWKSGPTAQPPMRMAPTMPAAIGARAVRLLFRSICLQCSARNGRNAPVQ